MAYILSDIADRVRNRIRDTGFSPSETRQYINDTINDIFNEYRLKFMRATQTYTVTSGDSDITHGVGLPTNYVQAIKLVNTTTGQERDIPYITQSELDELYPDNTDTIRYPNNTPIYYYDDGDTLRLFPAPGGSYTLSLRYDKKPTELVLDGDIPEIPSEFAELLVVGAAYRILQVKDNYDQAGILQNKYDEQLQKLVVRYSTGQVGSPRIMNINRFPSSVAYPLSFKRR